MTTSVQAHSDQCPPRHWVTHPSRTQSAATRFYDELGIHDAISRKPVGLLFWPDEQEQSESDPGHHRGGPERHLRANRRPYRPSPVAQSDREQVDTLEGAGELPKG